MTWKVYRSTNLDDVITFMNLGPILVTNMLPVFQDNNGSYVLIYKS